MSRSERQLPAWAAASLCIIVLASTLAAGLWPFQKPKNDVSWLHSSGLRLGGHGSLMSASLLHVHSSGNRKAVSVEIRIRPARNQGFGTFLATSTDERLHQFSLRQYRTGFVVGRETRTPDGGTVLTETFVDEVFRQDDPVLITLTSDGSAAQVFVNGVPARSSNTFAISSADLSGELIVGDSPGSGSSWHGDLLGLAVYNRKLDRAEVQEDYRAWADGPRPAARLADKAVALFDFSEGHGRVVYNRTGGRPNLMIPDRYTVVHKTMFQPPWKEFRNTAAYWFNVAINIAGFVPLGFFVFTYLSVKRKDHAATAAVLIGAGTSFLIELLQAHLPTRESGVTDLITNTLGTYLGIGLCQLFFPSLWFGFLSFLYVPARNA